MRKLRRRIPNLTALAFLECAGRHMSFSRAATELHVTQGAVSRQIRLLEESLGAPLFRRLHRAVELTPQGRRLHQAVTVALSHVLAATEEIAGTASSPQLTVAATHAMSTFWLMPRIPRLRASFPQLDVQVLATDAELDELNDRFSIGIRYGNGRWPGYHSLALGACEMFPVCSPRFLEGRERIRTPNDLLHEPLLYFDDHRLDWVDWPSWFAHQGVAGPYPKPRLRVNSYPLLLQAAIDGQGIALGWGHLVQSSIDSGALVVPLMARVIAPQSMYLAIPEDQEWSDEIQAVSEWFVAEFGDASPELHR